MATKQKIYEVENTPFKIYKKDEKKFVIIVGNNIISSKTFDKAKKAEEYIADKPWELIVNLAFLAIQKSNELNLNNKEEKK